MGVVLAVLELCPQGYKPWQERAGSDHVSARTSSALAVSGQNRFGEKDATQLLDLCEQPRTVSTKYS